MRSFVQERPFVSIISPNFVLAFTIADDSRTATGCKGQFAPIVWNWWDWNHHGENVRGILPREKRRVEKSPRWIVLL